MFGEHPSDNGARKLAEVGHHEPQRERGVARLHSIDGSAKPERIRISDLVPGDSPRLSGEDRAHILRLVESDTPFPPILVHRSTMRIIDGAHRVRAAEAKGWADIDAVFFNGSEAGAFVLSVECNIEHGLPLSLADRRVAAARIIESHGDWSDRMIARSTGLSAKTVRSIRNCSTEESAQSNTRRGQDGRVRPLTAVTGRKLAAELIASKPDASLREIARAAGISPGTVRDVRDRVKRGEDPVLPPRGEGVINGDRKPAPVRRNADQPVDVARLLNALVRDPSLRMNEGGRQLLRWLYLHVIDAADGREVISAVPDHSAGMVAELAAGCAEEWSKISYELGKRITQ